MFGELLSSSSMPKNAILLIFLVSVLKHLDFLSFSMAGLFLTPIFFFPKLSRSAVRPTQPRIQQVPGFISVVKRLGREVNHWPPSSAEFKNEWSSAFNPLSHHTRFHVLERDSFTFYWLLPLLVSQFHEICPPIL